jgi:hypothetical protein
MADMKPRHAAALALAGWCLSLPTVAICTESDSGNKWSLMMPRILETQHGPKIELDEPLNLWWEARKYSSREICEQARTKWPYDAATRQQVLSAKCILSDDLMVWCLSLVEGKEVPKHCKDCKDCEDCAYTLELRGHGCANFKTEGLCRLAADKYVQDYYVRADERGLLVAIAPVVRCTEIKHMNVLNPQCSEAEARLPGAPMCINVEQIAPEAPSKDPRLKEK